MKKLFYTIALALLVCASAQAQDDHNHGIGKKCEATIHGHVIDYKSNQHIPYITVTVDGTTVGTTTDATGHYTLYHAPVGKLTVSISAIGYESKSQEIEVECGSDIQLNFETTESNISVDEVVVSATRNETNKKYTATVVNIVSKKLFENTASSNLAESMNFQAGLRVENTCTNCGVPQLRINGLEGQYSQILLDSRPIFSSLAAVYGLEQLPVAMVERVEVIRGGGSALFGSNAIGGVVNIITKEPMRNSLSLSHTTHIIEDGTPDFNTALNGSFVSDDHRLGVYLFGQVRDRHDYDRNLDGFSDIPQLNSETVGFRGYYKTSAYSRITAEYHHTHEFRRGGNNLSMAPHMADICEQLDHKIDGGSLSFDYFSPDSRHRVNIYAALQNIQRDSYFGTDMNPNAYGNTSGLTAVAGGQYTFNYKCIVPTQLTVGAEYNYDHLNDYYIATDRRLDQRTDIYGAYAQNEWKSDKLNLLIGARLDKHNLIEKPIISPRANIRYSPIEAVGLRVSYSSGYRAPQTYNEDLHIDALNHSISLIGLADDLRPEYSHSISGSVDLYHNFGRLQTNLLLEGFYTMLDDVFILEKVSESQGVDGEGNPITIINKVRRNAAGATVGGITAELKVGIRDIFEVQLGYTFQKSRYREPEKWSDDLPGQTRMFRTPEHYGYLASNFNIYKGLKASLFGTFTGPMLVQHNAGMVDYDRETITESFVDVGTKFSYTIPLTSVISLEINAGVKNIFDEYQRDLDFGAGKDASYLYGPALPRTYFVGVKLTL